MVLVSCAKQLPSLRRFISKIGREIYREKKVFESPPIDQIDYLCCAPQCVLLVFVRFLVRAYCASIFLHKHAVDTFNECLFSLGDFGKKSACRFPHYGIFDFFGPLQLIPIEKLFSIRDSIGKATEFFFFNLKKTIDPDGLNIHEETECSLLCYLIIFFNISLSLIYTISATYYENMLHMLEICLL